MKKQSNQFVLVCITLVLAAGMSWYLYFRQFVDKDTVNVNAFPKVIGSWTSEEIPITKEDFAILETDNAFVRKYTDEATKSSVYLYVVYSQTNRKVAHPPEICYTGSGFSITEDVRDMIVSKRDQTVIKANRLHLVGKGYDHISYYWFKVGGQFTPNYWEQQLLIAFYTLLGQAPSSALIRVSADVQRNDQQKTINDLKSFIEVSLPAIKKFMP